MMTSSRLQPFPPDIGVPGGPEYEEKCRAFVAALVELFKRYPLPTYGLERAKRKRRKRRQQVLMFAQAGRIDQVRSVITHVPTDELEAVIALIFD